MVVFFLIFSKHFSNFHYGKLRRHRVNSFANKKKHVACLDVFCADKAMELECVIQNKDARYGIFQVILLTDK